MLKMDLIRCFTAARIILIIFVAALSFFLGAFKFNDNILWLLPFTHKYNSGIVIVEYISQIVQIDTFKMVLVVILCIMYSDFFCKDKNSGYIRMVLNRTDITTYVQSNFFANTIAILIMSIVIFGIYILIMLPHAALTGDTGNDIYYHNIMLNHPYIYVIMVALTFGMVTSMCSSFGILLSVFQPDRFVSIGTSGLLFFILISFSPKDGLFDFYAMVAMYPTIGNQIGENTWVDFLWGIIFPFWIICLNGFLFYKILVRRIKNGEL
jgi:hypothetical protein